ncbi:MAG: hypothetical protein KF810_16760 [Rhizobiaceae bacterium]|nr:hypothetical protein [Rhizobiaceae bacterium]
MTGPENERLARVETQVDDMKKKVDAMYDAFVQAKGARWVIISLWIGIGAAIANIKVLLAALGVKFGG